jgi:hypothetical protein
VSFSGIIQHETTLQKPKINIFFFPRKIFSTFSPGTLAPWFSSNMAQADPLDVSILNIDDWSDINPQFLLDELHKVSPDEHPGKKAFYTSYKVYNKLDFQQLGKMKSYFLALSDDMKVKVHILSLL